jgi:hypothetical protein
LATNERSLWHEEPGCVASSPEGESGPTHMIWTEMSLQLHASEPPNASDERELPHDKGH